MQEKALVGALSVIVKTKCETDGSYVALDTAVTRLSSSAHLAGEGDAGDVGLHVAVAVLHRLGHQQVLVGVRPQSVQIHLAAERGTKQC